MSATLARLLCAAFAVALATPSHGNIGIKVVDDVDSDGDPIVRAFVESGGSINLDLMTRVGNLEREPSILKPQGPAVRVGGFDTDAPAIWQIDPLRVVSWDQPPSGTGAGLIFGETNTGAAFGIFANGFVFGENGDGPQPWVYVPDSYVSGEPFPESESIFPGTLADLGITETTILQYTWTDASGASGESVRIEYFVGTDAGPPSVVPMPTAAWLGVVAGLTLVGRRRSVGR